MALSSVGGSSLATKTNTSKEGLKVKQERPDDEEINALAAKMVEDHKAKMAASAARPLVPGMPGQTAAQMVQGTNNQPTIINFLSRNVQNASVIKGTQKPPQSAAQQTAEKPPCDLDSLKMRFGWVTLGKNHIPYILRYGTDKYCAVRMVEMKLLSKYLTYLHSDIYNCTCIRSYYITEAEARLLNDINLKHCEGQFGTDQFTTKDLVVRLQDADEFYTFLDVCYNKLLPQNNSVSNKCGFIRIDGESVVPYILRNDTKYVPVFYFEGEISSLFSKAELLEGWDLAYLKFCCKVQGIRAELFEKDNCSVISLEDIKGYFPAETEFEDYWPSKVVDRQLLVSTNKSDSSATWTISPSVSGNSCAVATPPPPVSKPAPANPVSRQQVHSTPYNMGQQMTNGWTGLVGGQQVHYPSHSQQQQQQQQAANRMAIMHNVPPQTGQVRPGMRPNLTSHQYYQQGSMPMGMASPTAGNHITGQPPPLVRVTGAQPTMGTNTLYSSTGVMPHMMNLQAGATHPTHQMLPPPPQPHPHYPAAPANNKFPPPLVSVNGTTSPRYHYIGSSNGTDVIDLSSPPQSPQMGQRQYVSNGKTAMVENRGGKLISISDFPTTSVHKPYKVQNALVDGKMVPCINSKPYVYTELLMTIPDLIAHFFPLVEVSYCRQLLQDVLALDLYKGNKQQMTILKDAGKCYSTNDILPLVQVKDVLQFMPQIKYMVNKRRGSEEPPSKMKRIS